MENLQLKKFMENQMMFNKGIAENTDLLSKSNNGISEMIVSIDRGLDKLKEDMVVMNTKVNDLKEENEKIKEELEKAKEDFKGVKEETDGITKTFMTNGHIKRGCEKYINSLVYKEYEKNSIKDELLHGFLTAKCKKHLSNSFNVNSFNWLRIDDEEAICKIAKVYLSPKNIHILARKKVNELYKEMEEKKTQKHITPRKARQYELVTLLLEEIGGDKDLI